MSARAGSLWERRVGHVALVLLLGGCSWDTPMSTVAGRSDFARSILDVYAIITWATVVIALVVFGVLAWVLLRFRDRPGAAMPRQTHGHTALEIAWTIAPALVLLVIAIPTVQIIFRTQAASVSPDALQVTVRGWQWWWEFRYPGLDVVTANELYLPVGRTVTLRLEGPDVIHSFWVPQLGGKRDVIPGRVNHLSFTPATPGEYRGQCAEFCGASHANMRMKIVVVPPDAFDRWVASQRTPGLEPSGAAAEGKAIYARSACVGCHTIRGVSSGTIAPDLTHFGSRATFAAGLYPNTVDDVAAWILDPVAMKPAAKMPALGLTPAEARALATYLTGLK
ncbi:MAG: cytochrome c oxidase subunit II [Candidatus Rokubacteria bacterium]|nr:cytochrome c oxidase subunit II [Candidatus Rokubacteria bacterium]